MLRCLVLTRTALVKEALENSMRLMYSGVRCHPEFQQQTWLLTSLQLIYTGNEVPGFNNGSVCLVPEWNIKNSCTRT